MSMPLEKSLLKKPSYLPLGGGGRCGYPKKGKRCELIEIAKTRRKKGTVRGVRWGGAAWPPKGIRRPRVESKIRQGFWNAKGVTRIKKGSEKVFEGTALKKRSQGRIWKAPKKDHAERSTLTDRLEKNISSGEWANEGLHTTLAGSRKEGKKGCFRRRMTGARTEFRWGPLKKKISWEKKISPYHGGRRGQRPIRWKKRGPGRVS